jgi:hypothetical protein
MEIKAIMKTPRIFTGKQKEYNIQALTLLYDHGPMTAWGLTAKIPCARGGRQSLHATLSKSLKRLEKKGYVHREDKKWHLRFKGIIATLLILDKIRIWNPIWKDIYEVKAQTVENNPPPVLKKFGITNEEIHNARKNIGLSLEDFNKWLELTKTVKSLMENGIIDFDLIKEEALFGLIIMQSMNVQQISEIWNPDKKPTNP